MTIKDHHLLCLGLLAKIGIQGKVLQGSTSMEPNSLEPDDLQAIREAILSAQSLGMPVEVEKYDAGKAIHRMSKDSDRRHQEL